MKSIFFLFFLLAAFNSSATADGRVLKTPIEIVDLDIGYPSRIQMEIGGATEQSQVVIFLKLSNSPGLIVASDEKRQPSLPVTDSVLPPASYPQEVSMKSRWEAMFNVPQEYGRILEVYAVVCTVNNRKDWSRTREYKGFMYLPFEQAQTIDQALQLLNEFGWKPTGVTMFSLMK